MLTYIIIVVIILFIALFVLFKHSQKKSKPLATRQPVNRQSTSIQNNIQTKDSFNPNEVYKQITALINDRNFFAAEAQIKESLNKNDLQQELYLLLLDIYLLQNDEFAIQELLNKLNTDHHQHILHLVKSKIRENNNTIETIEFQSTPTQKLQTAEHILENNVKEIIPEVDIEKYDFSIKFDDENQSTTKTSIDEIEIKLDDQNPIFIDPLLEEFPDIIETDEIALNLELAQKYIELGAYEDAKRLIAEKEDIYNQEQRNQANLLLKQIAS